jgi:hypothetical protein
MPNKKFSTPLTDNCVLHLYQHYLGMYQSRYTQIFPIAVTWGAIHHWRMCVTYFGNVLIERNLLTREQYLQQKQFRCGDAAMIINVQQVTADNKSDILFQA